MQTTTKRLSLWLATCAAVLLATVSAHAETPSYVGTWAADLAQCKVPQERTEAPLVLKEKRFDQYETHCTFKSIEGGDEDEWSIKADCLVEGNAEPYDFVLTVSGDTLTVTDEVGTRDLLRCH